MSSPRPDEFDPYYSRYIARVPEGNIAETLASQIDRTLAVFSSIPEDRGTFSYGPGKWTIKEVIGHMSDTERVMAYRAFRIARGDTTPLASFEQDAYVATASADAQTIATLAEEFAAVRRASVALFRQLDDAAMARRGTASGTPVTARALAYIIAGHELHHVELLGSKYLLNG